MRKHLCLLLLTTACLYYPQLKAQNWVNGGNTLTANGTLGTNSNHSLIFETVNVPKGILTNTGLWHLGGTTTPAAKVQITHNSTSGTSPHLLLYESASDYARFYFKNTNTTNYFGIAGYPASVNASAKFNFLYSAVGDILTIQGDKKVGIGTTAPVQLLHVAGNGVFTGNLGVGTTAPTTKLHVVGNTYISGNLGIGTATPSFKLHVEGGTGTAVYGISSNYTPSLYGYNTYSGGTGVQGQSPYIGVYGYAGAYGLYGVATNAGGYGVQGINNSGAPSSGIGVYGSSSWIGVDGNGNLFGVRGNVSGASAYAVGGISSQSVGIYGYSGNASSYAGFFGGKVNATGGYVGPSDRKLKQNITDPGSALDIIKKLQPKAYEFRQDGAYQLMNLPRGKHFGLIAQDVEEVLPNLVEEAEFNTARTPQPADASATTQRKEEIISFKALNYTELIPILVKGMQEQQLVIEQQQQQIDKLEQMVNNLSNGQGLNTFLSNAKLGEVIPNPVKSSATIHYSIPDGSGRAHLLITDALGRQIKALQLSKSGVINVDVSALANGVYNYSLVVDYKTVATRKMTIVK